MKECSCNSSPEVSVIVPVYKAENTIEACVSSILGQDRPDFELILVDDGSPDGSGALCDALARGDARIRVIHQRNMGAGAARNAALDVACGDWVVFVDADDIVDADYLSRLFAMAPVVGELAMTGMRSERSDGTVSVNYSFASDFVVDRIQSNYSGVRILDIGFPYAKRYDLSLIRRCGLRFPTDICMNEDHIFYLDYLLNCDRLVLFSGTPYLYKYTPGSLSKSRRSSPDMLLAGCALADSMEALLRKWPSLQSRWFNYSITLYGLGHLIAAYDTAATKEEKKKAAAAIHARSSLFLRHYRSYNVFRTLKMFLHSPVIFF